MIKKSYNDLKCGLIGEKLGHSFSPLIHSYLSDYSYELCELERSELDAFMRAPSFDAFNVTIPYKQDVIPYLDYISPEAKAIGAVNTVVNKNGRLCGYNTDYFGFGYMLDTASIDVRGKKALVFGAGGTSLTACAVLRDRGAKSVTVVGRADNNKDFLAAHFDAQIIVNTTPVGMYPNNLRSAIDLSMFPYCEGVADVIFNPARTALIIDAESRGIPAVNGLPMLVAQAAKAFEFFTGDSYIEGCIDTITADISRKTRNIVLIGMPSCGKSRVGKILADKLSRTFVDADVEFKKMHKITPAEAITTLGEDKFRDMEHLVICELGKQSGQVIACGGGVVTREYNYAPLHQNGMIIFLERDLDKLSSKGRPISKATTPAELYAKRIDAYHRFSDIEIRSTEIPDRTADEMINKLDKADFSCVFSK